MCSISFLVKFGLVNLIFTTVGIFGIDVDVNSLDIPEEKVDNAETENAGIQVNVFSNSIYFPILTRTTM